VARQGGAGLRLRWVRGLSGAEAILKLRTIRSNGDLDTCWR